MQTSTIFCARDVKLSREIMLKRAVIKLRTMLRVVCCCHSTSGSRKCTSRIRTIHRFWISGIEFPMTLSQIKKFETLNDISINVYIEKEIMPIWLAHRKRSKHVNILYMEIDNEEYFTLIKDLSRNVSSQIKNISAIVHTVPRYVHIIIIMITII